jgi:hypothetical protein
MIANLENVYSNYAGMMRAVRNSLLRDSDWTQLPDADCDREAWATYRQALRDFPTTWEEGPTAEFPDTP